MSAGSLLQTRTGPIIPLYVSANSSLFTNIMNQKDSHPNVPVAVIIDINNGPDTAVNSAWQTTINNLAAKNIIVLGYVSTDFAQRAQLDVETDIQRWFDFYNGGTTLETRKVDGIYFAQMSNSATNQTYYSDLQVYAKTTVGFKTTCGGAGTKVPTSFLNNTCADTVIIYEGAGLPPPSDYQTYQNTPRNNIAFTAFGIASVNDEWVNQVSSFSNWIYMTNDQGSNPWDTLPSYFGALMNKLDSVGEGTSAGSQFDSFGIRKIYHTLAAGQEWYVNMDDPVSDSRLENEPQLFRNNDGSWSCEGGSNHQVRLEAWSAALSNDTDRQNARWLDAEVTGYMKAEQEFAQGGPFLFQLYVRGGHHSDDAHCEGSTLKGALSRRKFADGDSGLYACARKEVCHAAYCDNRAVVREGVIDWDSTDFYNKWVGMKLVVYNVDSGTHTKQEIYLDANVQDSNGNLNAQNDWKLVTTNVDSGGWFANQTTFDRDCNGCGYPRDRIITMAGGNTSSGTTNYHRNLAAWRTDDFRFRWKYLTVRQIDPSKPATGTTAPPPSTDPASAFDSFGVRKIYATKQGGNEWYMPTTQSGIDSDTRLSSNRRIVVLADGSGYTIKDPSSPYSIFYYVTATTGYDKPSTEAAAKNHGQCAANGFMYKNGDWRNVEMTVYVKTNQVQPDTTAEYILFARGGEHLDPGPYCAGSSMKGYLMSNGQTRFAKEQYHVFYNYSETQNQLGQDLFNRWVGYKYVLYNRKIGNQSAVKQEIYVDNGNTNTWIKIDEQVDTNGWGTGGTQCKGNTDDFQITWGGPIAAFRFDNVKDVVIAKMSIREIDGDAIAIEPAPSEPPGSCQTT